MITASRSNLEMHPAPAKIDDGPALAEEFQFSAGGTQYRVLTVSLSKDETLVLAEPCGVIGQRRWFPLSGRGQDELAVTYVAEKLGIERQGSDAHNLTLLIGYALQRPVLVFDAAGEYLERRDPA